MTEDEKELVEKRDWNQEQASRCRGSRKRTFEMAAAHYQQSIDDLVDGYYPNS